MTTPQNASSANLQPGANAVSLRRRLPIGMQTFSEIREEGHYHVDKTGLALQQRQQFTPDLGRIVVSETLLSTFDLDRIPVEALLFQAGYLTIADVWRAPDQMEIMLKYPILEVQASLNKSLLQSLIGSLNSPVQKLAACTSCCIPLTLPARCFCSSSRWLN